MNKLNEMNIAELSEDEVAKLRNYEEKMNEIHDTKEIYLLALKK